MVTIGNTVVARCDNLSVSGVSCDDGRPRRGRACGPRAVCAPAAAGVMIIALPRCLPGHSLQLLRLSLLTALVLPRAVAACTADESLLLAPCSSECKDRESRPFDSGTYTLVSPLRHKLIAQKNDDETVDGDTAPAACTPSGDRVPPIPIVPRSPALLNNSGIFDTNTGESSLFLWSGGGAHSGQLVIFETIQDKYPGMAYGPHTSYCERLHMCPPTDMGRHKTHV